MHVVTRGESCANDGEHTEQYTVPKVKTIS